VPERSSSTTLRPWAAIVALSTSRSSAADLDGGNMILRLVNSWLQHNNAKLGEVGSVLLLGAGHAHALPHLRWHVTALLLP